MKKPDKPTLFDKDYYIQDIYRIIEEVEKKKKQKTDKPIFRICNYLNNIKKMKNYYFTFGHGHKHPETEEPMHNYWIKVAATDFNDARAKMFEKYSDKWAFQYEENQFDKSFFPNGEYETL